MEKKDIERYMEDSNIHAIGYGMKVQGGVETGEMGIIFHVHEKKPLSELEASKVLPYSLIVNGSDLVTDVVQDKPPELIGCKDWVPGQRVIDGYGSGTLASAEQNLHRVKVRPVVGGMSITEVSKNVNSLGTLGCLVRDNEDGSIVGLTNAHVVISCPVDPVQHTRSYVENHVSCPVVQPATYEPWDGTNSSIPSDPLVDRVGLVKRSSFYNHGQLNVSGGWTVFIDAALVHMDQGSINSSSALIKGFESFGPMQFASSSEINSLLSGGNDIYVSGRTTGAKGGPSCRVVVKEYMYVISIFVGSLISESCGIAGVMTTVNFFDIPRIRYQDDSLGVVVPGDSGSVAVADFSGVKKIVGLVFAAGGQNVDGIVQFIDGFFCRIDKVAEQMNISSWDGSNIKHSNPSSWQYLKVDVELPDPEAPRSSLPPNDIIFVGGKKYWKIGSERKP